MDISDIVLIAVFVLVIGQYALIKWWRYKATRDLRPGRADSKEKLIEREFDKTFGDKK